MKIKLAVVLASTLFVTVAHAHTFTPGFYVGAELGYSPVRDLSGSPAAEVTSYHGGDAHISQNKGVFSGRVFGGYKINENIDLELGYFQSASFSQSFNAVVDGEGEYSGGASQKNSGFDYSMLLRPSISTGFNGAFLRLGGHHSRYKQYMTLTDGETTLVGDESSSGSGVLVGLGYDFSVAKHADIRTEYSYMESIDGKPNGPTSTFRIGIVGKF
jgi:opacity protein-like surface antigen